MLVCRLLVTNAQSILPHAENNRCYEVKIEKSKKAVSWRESNPGHWLEPPMLCH